MFFFRLFIMVIKLKTRLSLPGGISLNQKKVLTLS